MCFKIKIIMLKNDEKEHAVLSMVTTMSNIDGVQRTGCKLGGRGRIRWVCIILKKIIFHQVCWETDGPQPHYCAGEMHGGKVVNVGRC